MVHARWLHGTNPLTGEVCFHFVAINQTEIKRSDKDHEDTQIVTCWLIHAVQAKATLHGLYLGRLDARVAALDFPGAIS